MNQLTFVRSSFVRCLDGWRAVESRCVAFCWCDLSDGRIWGDKRNDKLHPVFCEYKASDILWFEAAHEMGSFESLAEKQLSGTFNEELFQKEHLTEIFAWGRATSHPYGRGEKGTSWGYFQEAVQDFLNFELESLRTCVSSLWTMWIFLIPSTLQ